MKKLKLETPKEISLKKQREFINPDITIDDFLKANPNLSEDEKKYYNKEPEKALEELKKKIRLIREYLLGYMKKDGERYFLKLLTKEKVKTEEEAEKKIEEEIKKFEFFFAKINQKYQPK